MFYSYKKEGRIATPWFLLACIFAKGGWTCLIVGDGFSWWHHPPAWHFFLVALWPLDNSSYPALLLPRLPAGTTLTANPIFRRLLKAGHHPAVLAGASEGFSLPRQAGGCHLKTGRAEGSALKQWLLPVTFCSLTMHAGQEVCFFQCTLN